MTSKTRRAWAGFLAILTAWTAVACVGCGGGMSIGPSVRVPLEQRQTLDAAVVGKQLHLPRERAFNIHVKQSSQNPGANGTAQGTADATEQGTASCAAVVSNGGTATGEFSIGQAIDYTGATPVRATVRVAFRLAHELSGEPVGAATSATLTLTAFVRDSAGRISPRIAMESLSSDDAPGKATRSDTREFTFVMEPAGSYQIILQGNVNAASEASSKASASLNLDGLEMSFTFAPATPPVPTSAPGQR